jgi:iron complex transport system substrate-binding protein
MNTAHAAAVDTQRIVALEWLPVELLLALGITPYGIADIPNYKLWVSEPPLPDSVIDVGLRTRQSRTVDRNETLVFAVVGRLWSFPEKLARIAPGRGFNFSDGKKPLAVARQSLQEMAQLFNLQASAERHLTEYDRFIASLKPRFIQRGARPVLTSCLIHDICWCLAQTACFRTCWMIMGSQRLAGRDNFWAALP